ncbi:undecaprenyl diphosphate synthase family protein [Nocardioides endophyticus]
MKLSPVPRVCEAYWPDFRRVDFLRAIRTYAERERRFGS